MSRLSRLLLTHSLVAAVAVAATLAVARFLHRDPTTSASVGSPDPSEVVLDRRLADVYLDAEPLDLALAQLARASGVVVSAD